MGLYNAGITCLIFCILSVFDPIYSNTCGKLSFEQNDVTECQTASLIYTPYHMTQLRKWIQEVGSKNIIYDTESTNNETKYIESRRGEDSFILNILETDLRDSGSYIVQCTQNDYSERATLNVTQGSSISGCSRKCGELSVKNTNVKEGDLIEFKFTVYPGRPVTWEKKHGSTFEQLVEDRYDIISNGAKTTHSMTILKSVYGDRGEYRVNCGTNVSNSVNLNVFFSEPSVPVFSHVESTDYCQPNGCILANLNEPVTVECLVKGGSKPIDLKMLKNGQEITDVIKMPEDTDNNSYIKYSFTTAKSDVENEVILTCIVKNPALAEALSNSTMLYVKVAPEKDPEINPIEVREGTQGQIQCVERNIRPPLKAKLLIGRTVEHNTSKTDERMPGNLYTVTTSSTKIFTRFQNQIKVRCCSCISAQKCVKTKINVLFPPNNISVEEIWKDNQENGDTMVQLKYLVAESNPKSSYELTGVKNIQRSLVSKTYELDNNSYAWTLSAIWNFTFTRDDNKRVITLNVITADFQPQSVQYQINITYYPIITISGQNIVYLGDDVSLACNVTSNPPSIVTWYNQTGPIKESYQAGKLDLHLTNVSTDHSQTYTCTAYNGIGEMKSRNITLTVKDPSERPVTEALTPTNESNLGSVIGPIIGCLILAIIIMIIIVLLIRKNRRNVPLERRNTPQIKIEERKPSVNPTGNEPIYNNMAASRNDGAADEPPEYACVIPKDKRGEAKGNTGAAKDAGKKNKDGEDNLVYADLDLAEYPDLAAKRPLVTMNEQTEYVSIDFSKTGAAIIDNDGDKN